jgi:hypothetical protein
MTHDLSKLVQNAPERPEYGKVLETLQPVLHDLPPKIVTIDGRAGTGKTTLGRFLAWRFNITLIETDLFLIRNTGKFEYRKADLKALINSRLASERPVIIEGVVVLRLLNELKLTSHFHIRALCRDAEGSTLTEAEWECYETQFVPAPGTSLIIELPVIQEQPR